MLKLWAVIIFTTILSLRFSSVQSTWKPAEATCPLDKVQTWKRGQSWNKLWETSEEPLLHWGPPSDCRYVPPILTWCVIILFSHSVFGIWKCLLSFLVSAVPEDNGASSNIVEWDPGSGGVCDPHDEEESPEHGVNCGCLCTLLSETRACYERVERGIPERWWFDQRPMCDVSGSSSTLTWVRVSQPRPRNLCLCLCECQSKAVTTTLMSNHLLVYPYKSGARDHIDTINQV